MRILLMPSSYPPVLGGLQTVAHTLALGLAEHGHIVQVVTNRYPRSLPSYEVLENVRVRRMQFLYPRLSMLQRRRPDLFMAGLYYLPTTIWALERLMRAFQPQIVNVHFPGSQNPFVLWLRRRYAFRLVVSLHGHEIEGYDQTSAWDQKLLRQILCTADAVTSCSRYLLDKAIALAPSIGIKAHVVYNGINLERFADKTAYAHSRPYILAYGRLTYNKGFDLLLEAFAQVCADYPELDLILAGEGEEKTRLQAQVARLKICDRVHFFGRATQEEVVRLLNGSVAVVVPSRTESFGIVALEALAANKPVIATKVGGLPEFMNNETNCLVQPTVSGLITGITQSLQDDDKRGSLRIQNRTRAAAYAWPQVVQKYLNLYHHA